MGRRSLSFNMGAKERRQAERRFNIRKPIRDIADRYIIQVHLTLLAKDFERFRERMDQVARYIGPAELGTRRAPASARKTSDRCEKIRAGGIGTRRRIHPRIAKQWVSRRQCDLIHINFS
jgi:hypothetical protein